MALRTHGKLASYATLLLLVGCSGNKDQGTQHTGGVADDTGTDVRDTGTPPLDADGDGYTSEDDCDDTNPDVNPGATEVCDGIDNDCNDDVDLDDTYLDRSTQSEFYIDADGDGYGSTDSIAVACDAPEGYGPYSGDCDETDPTVNPGAAEVCDDLDNDCNGVVDDSSTEGQWYYPDEDEDGIGVEGEQVLACSGAAITGDCDDTDPTEPQVVDASSTGLTAGSLAFPWLTIQDGIDAADTCVIVFAGTYNEAIDFSGKSISVTGVDGPGSTIIDATGTGSAAVSFSGGETSDAVLTGFTIQGGEGNLTESERSWTCGSLTTCYEYTSTYCGGGVYVADASPTLSALIIQDNSLEAASTSTSGNTTWYVTSFGGGVCVSNGSVSLSDSTIQGNSADVGGGIYLDESGQMDLSRAWIVANDATEGGGLAVDAGSMSLTNVASAWNLATSEGGGLYMEGGTLSATNVTWGEDDAPSGGVVTAGGAASLTIMNSILYGSNTGACLTFSGSSTLAASYNDLYGCAAGRAEGVDDPAGSSGNITANPEFDDVTDDGDPTNDVWQLDPESVCVDRGNPDAVYNDVDGTQNDLGAFGGAVWGRRLISLPGVADPVGDVDPAWGQGDLLQEEIEGLAAGIEGPAAPGFEDGGAEGVEVEVGGGRVRGVGGQRGEAVLRVLALGAERGVHGDGVGLVDEAGDDLGGGLADPAVEIGDLGFEGGASLGVGVGRGGERGAGLVGEGLEVVGREDLRLDGVEHEAVELLHADRDAGAGVRGLDAAGAVVEVGALVGLAAWVDADPAAAGAASEPGGQETVLAGADRLGAAALALLAGPVAQGADGGGAGEVGLGDGCGVRVAADDLAVVDDVAGVERVAEDLDDVLGPPGTGEALAGDILAAGRRDAFEGELLGEALAAVVALQVVGEDPLDRLEGRAGLIGDLESGAAFAGDGGVAEGGVAVDPEATFGLGAHAALDVAGQLLRVALGQPREDRSDQLAEGLVAPVRLGQGEDVDVGFVEGREGAQAVEHVPGDAREGPDVETIDGLDPAAGPTLTGVSLGFCAAEEILVGLALLGCAAGESFVDEPVLRRYDHAVGLGSTGDFITLLIDGLVLARVAAPQVRGADDGHGDSRVV